MKAIKLVTLVFGLVFLLTYCTQAPESDTAEVTEENQVDETATAEAQSIDINLETSKVNWVGTKPIGRHSGSFNVKEGFISVKDGEVVGGEYTVDVASLQVLDMPDDEENTAKLTGHLLSEDFFSAEEFPTAKFVITGVAPYEAQEGEEREESEFILENPTHTVTGNLELKGVTKGISFPARLEVSEGSVTAEAKFNINRKDWGMSYGADESLGDNFIRPTVHIGLDIKTK